MKMRSLRAIALLLGLGFMPPVILGAEKPTAPSATTKPPVINFEAELIEGKRKNPDLFLQTSGGLAQIDGVIYLRQNFNDYHALDRKRRPRLRPFTGKR